MVKKQQSVRKQPFNKNHWLCSFVFNFFVGKQKDKDAYRCIVEEMVQNGQLKSNEWKGNRFS